MADSNHRVNDVHHSSPFKSTTTSKSQQIPAAASGSNSTSSASSAVISNNISAQNRPSNSTSSPPNKITATWHFECDEILDIDIDGDIGQPDPPEIVHDQEKATENESEDGGNGARSLVDEIEMKYGHEQGIYASGSNVFVKQMSSPVKQLPGKRSASGRLEILILNGRSIGCLGDDRSKLSDLIGHITQIDLASNALSDWGTINTMLSMMPHLAHCNLSHNDLSREFSLTSATASSSSSSSSGGNNNNNNSSPHYYLKRMNSLVLNATNIRWKTLFALLRRMPFLEELHLSLNDYSGLLGHHGSESSAASKKQNCTEKTEKGGSTELPLLQANSAAFAGLHILHLNNCRIEKWETLKAICSLFPCLETLVTAENPIGTFGPSNPQNEADDGGDVSVFIEEFTQLLGCLHAINLNHWKINDWRHIDRLNHVPLLSELRMNHVPLIQDMTEDEFRAYILARVPAITVFNGSDVKAQERDHAERLFLRHHMDLDQKPKRYFELEEIHGKLEPLASITLDPKDRVTVRLKYEAKEELTEINVCQTVSDFKKFLSTFCGLPPGKFRVFYHDQEMVAIFGPEELKLPSVHLFNLRIEDNDLFVIEEKLETAPISTNHHHRRSRTRSSGCQQKAPSK